MGSSGSICFWRITPVPYGELTARRGSVLVTSVGRIQFLTHHIITHEHGTLPSNPRDGYWTNITRPPVTLREHQLSASALVCGPGRQFGKAENGPF